MRLDGRDNSFRREGATPTDPVWLAGTIGAIYDCVLDPSRWQSVVGAITDHFSFACGTLSVMQLGPTTHQVVVNYRIDDAWIAAMPRYGRDSIDLWGGPERVAAFPIEEPMISTLVRPREQWSENAYYREILLPRGFTDGMVMCLIREQSTICYFGMPRHESNGPIRDSDVEGLRLIAPHLRRALTISNLFDLKAVETATFQSVLDTMGCAVVLVDGELGIVHANRSAGRMLDEHDLMREVRGRLSVAGPVAGNALRAAVAVAVNNEVHLAQRGIGIPVTGDSGQAAVLHVLPLERRIVRPQVTARAVAAIFVVTSAAHSTIDLVAALYTLTPAEAHVLSALCRGETLSKAAAASGVRLSTIKTHLKRMFSKTGCSRQAELVALVARHAIAF